MRLALIEGRSYSPVSGGEARQLAEMVGADREASGRSLSGAAALSRCPPPAGWRWSSARGATRAGERCSRKPCGLPA
jgi:hypothetical protein